MAPPLTLDWAPVLIPLALTQDEGSLTSWAGGQDGLLRHFAHMGWPYGAPRHAVMA